MDFFIKADIPPAPFLVSHNDRILLIGSCFTSNVGKQLEELKFSVLHNPTGILFDPYSVVQHLRDALHGNTYSEKDLALNDEVWHSYDHHTDFSATNQTCVTEKINEAIVCTGDFLKKADVLFITLGSAFYYRLAANGNRVANCHRFPSKTFTKHLAEIDEIKQAFTDIITEIRDQNPALKVVFTVSPVRHIREGVVNNNRSKARLLEAVHSVAESMDNVYYFPAYELVIDVLRDYRFYDIDMVHPNYQATRFVFDAFRDTFFTLETQVLCDKIREVVTAYRHRPSFPDTEAHRKFMVANAKKITELEVQTPLTDWSLERRHFNVSSSANT